MIERIICWLFGHEIEKDFYRTPVYQFFKMNTDRNDSSYGKYRQVDMGDDQTKSEWWCHRCSRYRRIC